MPIVAKSDLSTSNLTHASYLLRSSQLSFLFTAPYSPSLATMENMGPTTTAFIPTFNHDVCRHFASKHGLGVRAIAIEVDDAEPVSSPFHLDKDSATTISEVHLYGDAVLCYVSFKSSSDSSIFLPKFEAMNELSSYPLLDFKIRRLDHAVGNVPELALAVSYLKTFTGFHEFTAEDVGTSESELNSVVLANNEEMVLANCFIFFLFFLSTWGGIRTEEREKKK
ncbi:4-hydroxyphenylpyruvate dioxygenase [Fagus crenata]